MGNADIILLKNKQSPLSVLEADDNFMSLEDNYSEAPVFQELNKNRHIYMSGDLLDFKILNFDNNVLYMISSDAGIIGMDDGSFSAYPIGDGLNLFVISEDKIPNSTMFELVEQYLALSVSLVPNSNSNSTLDGSEVVCNSDGLVTEILVNTNISNSPVIGIKIKLVVTIKKVIEYDKSISTIDEIFFRRLTELPSKITAFNYYSLFESVYDTAGIVYGDYEFTKDILGDGSCIDAWSFNNTLDNFDGTNIFSETEVVTSNFEAGRFENCFRVSAKQAGTYVSHLSALDNPIIGDAPMTICGWFRSDAIDGTDSVGFSLGGYGTRYNVEITLLRATSTREVIYVHGHKRGWTATYTNYQSVGWRFICYTYSPANASRIYLDNRLVASDPTVMGFLANPYGISYHSDVGTVKGAMCQVRVFDKEVTAIEMDKIRKEGYASLPLVPPTGEVTDKILCGEVPAVSINDIIRSDGASLLSDDGENVIIEVTKGATPYSEIYENPEVIILCNNSDNGYNTRIAIKGDYTANKNK